MTNGGHLSSSATYSASIGSVRWEGRVVTDTDRFKRYMREVVRARIKDDDSSFDTDIRGLQTTGMATDFVERLLCSVPEPEAWEVGEALAECALRDDWGRGVTWPWNTVRDRRTPRASLPGADLVGFCVERNSVVLLFGEVKTSSDVRNPPGVMNGGSGMAWQLEQSANRLDIQHALLRWLQARCQRSPYRELYQSAVKRFLSSEGKDVLLVGVLIRDTMPNEFDLKARGNALSAQFNDPTQIELLALYVPIQIPEWSRLLKEVIT